MNKQELEAKLEAVLKEANELEKASTLEMETTLFLRGQADKLLEKKERPDTTPEEKEKLEKEIGTLQKRIHYEIAILEKNVKKATEIEAKLDHLKELAEQITKE